MQIYNKQWDFGAIENNRTKSEPNNYKDNTAKIFPFPGYDKEGYQNVRWNKMDEECTKLLPNG